MNFKKLVAKFLFDYTKNRPARLIKVLDRPYLERYYVGKLFGYTFYLHRFVGNDGDRALHDHPWNAMSFVLAGEYKELVKTGWAPNKIFTKRVTRSAPTFNFIPNTKFHQILGATKETWTLFAHGERLKDWGYLTEIDASDGAVLYYPHENQHSSLGWYNDINVKTGKDVGREDFIL